MFIISLSRGIDFLGFRNFYNFRLVRKRNIRKMEKKLKSFLIGEMNYKQITDSFQGWQAYVKWSDSIKLRRKVAKELYRVRQLTKDRDEIDKYFRS